MRFWLRAVMGLLQCPCPLMALSGHCSLHRTCPLSGVERTTVGGKLHLRLCRNDLLKISRPERSKKTRWGKHWGKQLRVSKKSGPRATLLGRLIGRAARTLCRQRQTDPVADRSTIVALAPAYGGRGRTHVSPRHRQTFQRQSLSERLLVVLAQDRRRADGKTSLAHCQLRRLWHRG